MRLLASNSLLLVNSLSCWLTLTIQPISRRCAWAHQRVIVCWRPALVRQSFCCGFLGGGAGSRLLYWSILTKTKHTKRILVCLRQHGLPFFLLFWDHGGRRTIAMVAYYRFWIAAHWNGTIFANVPPLCIPWNVYICNSKVWHVPNLQCSKLISLILFFAVISGV